jgi:hypothetical protein
MPGLPLAEKHGKPYVIKELIMGEILAFKHLSKRIAEDFTAVSQLSGKMQVTSNMRMLCIHL